MKNDTMLRACRMEKVDYTPIWIMRQAGRYLPEYREIRKKYSLNELFKMPEICADVTMMPIERFDLDAAVMFADIMLPLASIGIEVELKDNVGPVIKKPIRKFADVEALNDIRVTEAVPFVFETIKKVKKQKKVPLIGFSGAPFTLAGYIIDGTATRSFTETKKIMRDYPKTWHALMGRLADLVIEYLNAQITSGVDAVQLFDSWAGYLTPDEYREFAMPYSKKIFDALVRTDIPTIHFGTKTSAILELMRNAGGDTIGVDSTISIDDAWKRIGYDVGIQGNLDPQIMLGTKDGVRSGALDVLDRINRRKGHIFNLGHWILPDTPIENVTELVETVHGFELEN